MEKKIHPDVCSCIVSKIVNYALEECDFECFSLVGAKLLIGAKMDSDVETVCHAARCVEDKFNNWVDLSELLAKHHESGYTSYVVSFTFKML